MPCTVVVGAQWGDEGKGKVVDALSAGADLVARYQGGPNAGHSIIRGNETIVLHLVPSGVMHPSPRCLIGNGVVVDLSRLREEVDRLESLGIEVTPRLGLSPAAHLILPYHRAVEAAAERGPAAIGTTGRGIGFAYRDKTARTGLRCADLFDREAFVERADRNLSRLRLEYPEVTELADMSGASVSGLSRARCPRPKRRDCARRARSTEPRPAVRAAAAGSTCPPCATRRASMGSMRWWSRSSTCSMVSRRSAS